MVMSSQRRTTLSPSPQAITALSIETHAAIFFANFLQFLSGAPRNKGPVKRYAQAEGYIYSSRTNRVRPPSGNPGIMPVSYFNSRVVARKLPRVWHRKAHVNTPETRRKHTRLRLYV